MLARIMLAIVVARPAVIDAQNSAAQSAAQQSSAAAEPVKPEPPWPPRGVSRLGGGVTAPRLTRQTKPNYSAAAMNARIQGAVEMEAVVLADGSVGEVRVLRSLDKEHGLDDEAVRTVGEWRFLPGKKNDVAVPVIVKVVMSFTLRN